MPAPTSLPLLHLTSAFRKEFRERRLRLRLSMKQMAHFMGVHSTTVQHWENGQAETCAPACTKRLQDFVTGKFDHVLPVLCCLSPCPSFVPAELPVDLLECLSRLVHVLQPLPEHKISMIASVLHKLTVRIQHIYLWGY